MFREAGVCFCPSAVAGDRVFDEKSSRKSLDTDIYAIVVEKSGSLTGYSRVVIRRIMLLTKSGLSKGGRQRSINRGVELMTTWFVTWLADTMHEDPEKREHDSLNASSEYSSQRSGNCR